jgi:biopolymer transport protein ExbB
MTETVQTMVSFFTKGGLFMWPLLACSIVTVTTIVLSILTLREKKVLPLVIESEIERLVPGGSAERLLRVVSEDNSSLAPNHPRGVGAYALAAVGKH